MAITFPAPPLDYDKIVKEFEKKLGIPFNKEEHGVGISNANENILNWKYCELNRGIIHCYKASNIDIAEDIKQAIVDKGAQPLPNDNIEDKVYVEKPLFVYLRNLQEGESSQELYES